MDSTVCRTVPASQKRHTKPCRFFQKDTCPLSADRCDFAHVKIQILPVRYSTGLPRPVLAGQRDHGESFQPAAYMLPIDNGTQQSAAASHTNLVTEILHGPGFSRHGVDLRPVPDRLASSLAPSSVDGLVRLVFQGGDSPTSDVPSLSDGDSGPPSAACEAPELTERWPGSPSTFAPVYCNPSPGGFSVGVPFTLPAYGQWTASRQETRSRTRRPGISSRKLKALKTKQCKFFKKDGQCPQGNLCTFIHDPSAIRAPLSYQESPIDDSSSSEQSASSPVAKTDDDHGRKVYPVTWRVIGGGVMMGGQRNMCERFKGGGCPEGDDYDLGDTDSLLSSPIVTPRASDFPRGQIVDRSTKQLPMATPPILEMVHDLSPMILSGRRLLTTSVSREALPPRPFSTPPRVSSRTEATCLNG